MGVKPGLSPSGNYINWGCLLVRIDKHLSGALPIQNDLK
jgi:hypothetical protein